MRKTSFRILGLLLVLCSSISFTQENNWVNLMLKEDRNFYEIKEQFYEDWDGYEYTRGKGWKQFHRWEWFWETRILPDGSFPNFSQYWQRIKEHRQEQLSRGMNNYGGNWEPIGPFTHTNTGSWSSGQGRVNFVLEHPTNNNVIFVGAPAGGIWKTTTNGASWKPVSDFISQIGIACLAISQTNPNIMYAATGDPFGNDTYSVGLLKSTDGGDTWAEVGGVPYTLHSVLVDPTDEDHVYISATVGVYESTDGGVTFNQVLADGIDQIKFKPGDPSTIYAASNNEFYASYDSGATWTTAMGLPTSGSRIVFDVTEADPNRVYLTYALSGSDYGGVFRSMNSGADFVARDTLADLYDGSSQAWYDLALCVSDTDPDLLFHGVLNVWKSSNGGTSWNRINTWNSPGTPTYTHADIHFLDYQNGRLYCGSDGGVYRSLNNGNNFSDLTPGIQISQFYRIAGIQANVNRIVGGTQDNGGFSWNGPGNDWNIYHGADGMDCDAKETNPNHIYGMIQYGTLRFSNDGGNTSTSIGRPEEGIWVTPFQWDNQNNRIVAGYGDLYEFQGGNWNQISTQGFNSDIRHVELYRTNTDIILTATSERIWKSMDGGTNMTDITNNLTQLRAGNSITSIEIDPNDHNRIWVTIGGWTNNHKVMYTEDSGTTWTNISNDGSFPNINCNIVKYDPSSAINSIYVGTDIGVYHYNDNLGTWIPYVTNLPNTIVNDLEIHEASNIIRAGTYGRGVWQSGTYPDNMADEDLGIKRIRQPNGNVCEDFITPEIVVENFGMNNIYEFILKYQVDGNNPDSLIWTGNLASFDSIVISLPSFTETGAHTFKAWTELPNSVVDPNPDNDTMVTNFTGVSGGRLVTVYLQADCAINATSWDITNASSAVVAQGSGYTANEEGIIYEQSTCLDFECHDFNIADLDGDGLSISNPSPDCNLEGDYWIVEQTGDTLVQMTTVNFGSSTSHNFCLTQNTPVADFESNKIDACVGQTVYFTDLSTGLPDTWSWSFTGGSPANSTSANPTVIYNVPGTYEVVLTVTNGSGTDTKTESTYITIHDSPSVALVSADVQCYAQCNGGIGTDITSGTAPFTYEWSNNETTDSISNLCPGIYTVQIEDAYGCIDYAQVEITEPNVLEAALDTTMSNCGQNNGAAVLTITGGTTPYTEDWSGEDPNNLSAGTYPYTVTDANGCVRIGTAIIENINMPEVDVTATHIDCHGDTTGTAVANVTGGTPPYTIDWNGLDENALYSGLHTVTVTDDAGCIVDYDYWIYQSTTINMSPFSITDEMQGGDGAIDMAVNGGSPPFTFLWDTGATTEDISGLVAGDYTLYVTDSKNCDSSVTVTVGSQVSIDENEIHGALIYPNPVGNNLFITASTEDLSFDLYLIDGRGRKVFEKSSYNLMDGIQIDMSRFESGLYVLKMIGDNEEHVYRVIKK